MDTSSPPCFLSLCHRVKKSTASWTCGALGDPEQLPRDRSAARGRPLREEPARAARSRVVGGSLSRQAREEWGDSEMGARSMGVRQSEPHGCESARGAGGGEVKELHE